jgi:O-antigen/teichoic acid export membrane protein
MSHQLAMTSPHRRLLKAVRSTPFAQGVSAMVVFTMLANVANYGSSLVFSRILNPQGFGDLTSLLALSVMLAIPTGAAQTVISERVAVYRLQGDLHTVRYLVRHSLAHVGVIAGVVTLLYAALIPVVVSIFDLQAPGPAIALVPLVFLSFLQPVVLGALQGVERFQAYGVMLVCISVSRMLFGIPWALAGGGAGGAIGGQALGMLAVLLAAAFVLRRMSLNRGHGAIRAGLRRKPDLRAVTASVAFIAFAVIANLDVILAKAFLSSHDSGLYAAISTIGKIVLFIPAAIAVVMVPNAARAEHQEGDSNRVLRLSARLVAGTGVVVGLPLLLLPELAIKLMFGPGYSGAASGVLPIVIAGAALAMVNLLVVYSVAIRDQRWTWLLVVGVAAQVGGISAFHDSPADVAWVQAGVAMLVLVVNEMWFHSVIRQGPKR